LESTIINPTDKGNRILRSGPVTTEELSAFAPVLEDDEARTESAVEAPGLLTSHYAPRTPLFMFAAGRTPPPNPRAGVLCFTSVRPGFGASEVMSASGDLREAAARFFAALRRLDEAGLECIHAEMPPQAGLGIAINDRLRRAAAR